MRLHAAVARNKGARNTPNLGARLEWQRYQSVGGDNTGKENIDVFSIGALYSF